MYYQPKTVLDYKVPLTIVSKNKEINLPINVQNKSIKKKEREIKENLNTWRDIPWQWVRRLSLRHQFFSNLMQRFNKNQIEVPAEFFKN